MSEVVIELFFIDNFLMTYLVIAVSRAILREKCRFGGVVAVCALTSVLAVFAMNHPFLRSFVAKAIMLAGVTLGTYRVHSWKSLIKYAASILMSTFLLGGIVYALALMFSGSIEDGIVYAGDGMRVILIGAAAGTGMPRLVKRFLGAGREQKEEITLYLETEYGEATVCAKVDTGNLLREPVSCDPVVVADIESLPQLFPLAWSVDWKQHPVLGMRVIPFHSVGGEGVLPAVKLKTAGRIEGGRLGTNRPAYLAAGKLRGQKAIASGEWPNES